MGIRITQVDAFASAPFTGNPAAVCVLEKAGEEKWMQLVAREMNLSETAFLWPEQSGYRLRWFTPSVEVSLCGHATLASAHVLWESDIISPERRISFQTHSGILTAARADGLIELDFPAAPVTDLPVPPGITAALGISPVFIGRNEMDILVQVGTPEEVASARPDFGLIRELGVRGVILTASASGEHDFVSRFFAPSVGVDEDPATGSSHCCLAPFWAERLGKREMSGFQNSERTGVVRVALAGNRVKLRGRAITMVRGDLDTAACQTVS